MEIKVGDLRALMDALHEKTGEPRRTQGWKNIVAAIDSEDIGDRYLYKSIVLKTKKEKKANTVVSLRDDSIYAILNFLGHKNLTAFKESSEHRRDTQLDSCIGSYYSYIRANAKDMVLLRSPAQIFFSKGKYMFEQKGSITHFVGEIKSKKGCLFILLDSKEGKSFYHVYKVGTIKAPKVVQGIFSGVSSSFDPIGGRAVIIKAASEFKDLFPTEVKKSKFTLQEENMKELFQYFETRETNNLSINRSTTFSSKDLVG